MDHAHILLIRLWEPFNTFLLFLYSSAGVFIFALLGLILAIVLQRRGWLARRNRWHHGLLKLYFLLLPFAGGVLGFQAGSLYGTQQQIYRHLDSYAPLVQELADSVHLSFQNYLAEQDQAGLEEELRNTTAGARAPGPGLPARNASDRGGSSRGGVAAGADVPESV